MQILAHRGWWIDPSEANTAIAFTRALTNGFGIETDLRDCGGRIVVSHDMPPVSGQSGGPMVLDEFLDLYMNYSGRPTLALNIKADGLDQPILAALSRRNIGTYFVFDMAVPDTLHYLRSGMPVFTRRSEFENGSKLDEKAAGLWLDAFETQFVAPSVILDALEATHEVAIVSPELHKRPHSDAWEAWRRLFGMLEPRRMQRIMLCTDFPAEAAAFFSL